MHESSNLFLQMMSYNYDPCLSIMNASVKSFPYIVPLVKNIIPTWARFGVPLTVQLSEVPFQYWRELKINENRNWNDSVPAPNVLGHSRSDGGAVLPVPFLALVLWVPTLRHCLTSLLWSIVDRIFR